MSEGIIPPQKTHVTLLMLTIKNDAELNLVKDILKGIQHILPSTLPPSRKLKFKGVGSFNDRILYVSVEKEPSLESFVKILKQKFHKAGINMDGNRDVFVPHMSVMRSPSSASRMSPAARREVFSNLESDVQGCCVWESKRERDKFIFKV
jgi:2'-5' RNA ligase